MGFDYVRNLFSGPLTSSVCMSQYDMTQLKQEARDNHIGDDGRTERRNIFASIVKDVIGVEEFDVWTDKTRDDDVEEAWKHTSEKRCVLMKKTTGGGYEVFTVREDKQKHDTEEFGFSGKKYAEGEMLRQLEKHA